MCGIAGLASGRQDALGHRLRMMLETMQHRGPDGAGFAVGSHCQRAARLDDLDFEGVDGTVALGHVRLAITGEATGIQPFQSDDGSLTLLHNGEIYNYRDLAKSLPQERLKTGSDSEVLLGLIEQHYVGELEETLKTVLPMLDGVFALAITDQRQTVLVRDRIGVRQLYYVETDDQTLGFASERKPLLRIAGSRATKRLMPGEMMTIESGERRRFQYWSPEQLRRRDRIDSLDEALESYGQAITSAVRKRVRGRSRVGIIFSGGIDSVLIAHLVQAAGVPFTCYAAGRDEGSGDLAWAQRIAEQLDYPLQSARLSLSDIEALVPEIIRDIEDNCLNQVEVAVPIYAAVRMAQENGERVLLNGQGADELFGGYPWYSVIVGREGYGSFLDHSWEDTCLLYKECLEREDKISMAHSIELRVPFLDPEVVEAAFAIAPQLKIQSPEDTFRKWIHRSYSESIGIPSNVAFRPKEAAQHGANVHSAFDEIARRNGYAPEAVSGTGYDPSRTVVEMLGSSSRYGYRYGEQDLWEPMPHIQLYLDRIARSEGVLTADIIRYLDGLDRSRDSARLQGTLEKVQ